MSIALRTVVLSVAFSGALSAAASSADPCAEQKPLVWSHGFRHVQRYPEESRQKVLQCFGVTEDDAKKHDAVLDELRQAALLAILPKADKNKISEEACKIMMAATDETNDTVNKKMLVTTCIDKDVQVEGIDSPKLDMKAIQMKCIKCALPKMDEAAALKKYGELIDEFEKMETEALRVDYELQSAMRFTLDEGPTKDANEASRKECLKQLAPDVKPEQYLSHIMAQLKKGDLDTKKKIDACTYKNSVVGKWVRARQMITRDCALQAQKSLPANLQNDLKFLYALHLNATALETYLSCTEREETTIVDSPLEPSGSVDVYCTSHGKAPKKYPQCASDVYKPVDALKVEKEVDACYGNKEKEHPLYKEYVSYLQKVSQRKESIHKCLLSALGSRRQEMKTIQAGVVKQKAPAGASEKPAVKG